METRFAQTYYVNLNKSDLVMNTVITANKVLKSPFTGKTISCRACHMVDEHKEKFRLPAKYHINVKQASDRKILNTVAKLVAAYVSNLSFQVDKEGNYIGSLMMLF